MEAARSVKIASSMVSLSGKVLIKASIWDHGITKACGGGITVSGLTLVVFGFWGTYGPRNRANGAT